VLLSESLSRVGVWMERMGRALWDGEEDRKYVFCGSDGHLGGDDEHIDKMG
jgi:hypothetical protein